LIIDSVLFNGPTKGDGLGRYMRGLAPELRTAGEHVGHCPGPPPRPVITVRRSRLTRTGSSEAK